MFRRISTKKNIISLIVYKFLFYKLIFKKKKKNLILDFENKIKTD